MDCSFYSPVFLEGSHNIPLILILQSIHLVWNLDQSSQISLLFPKSLKSNLESRVDADFVRFISNDNCMLGMWKVDL